ncbi:hypothetical protein ACQ4PT_029463 [Festuca glaucescens]
MTGLPRGQLEVKYYADYDLEAVIAARLFPGGSSRPKVSDLARMVEQYEGADDSFKELWMLFIMSTVVAPTTDNKMSNKCYPMLVDIAHANELNLCKFVADELHDHLSNQKYTKGCLLYCMLRYFDALQTDHFELELGNARFSINAWSKLAIDAVGALDVQEYDTTTFGSLEVSILYMSNFSMQLLLTCIYFSNFASSLNGLLSSLVQGLTQCSDAESSDDDGDSYNEDVDMELSEREAHQNDASGNVAAPTKVGCATSHAKKQIVSPVVGRRNEGQQDGITSPAKISPAVETQKKLREDTISSASPPAMHSQINVPSFSDLDGSDEVNGGGNETDSPLESTPQDDERIRGSAACFAASLSNCKRTKESRVPSSSETIANNRIKNVVALELGIPVRVSEQGSDSTAMKKSVPDHGQQGLETIPEREIIDDHLNATSVNVDLKGKDVIIDESTTSGNLVDAHVPPVVSNETPKKSDKADRNGGNDVITGSASPEDGKSSSTTFVVSPTFSTKPPQKDGSHIVGDGNSLSTAIAISPTVTMQQGTSNVPSTSGDRKCPSVEEGKTKDNAIPIYPNVSEAQAPHLDANTCRSIVSSLVAQRQFTAVNSQSRMPWRLSPLVGANLGQHIGTEDGASSGDDFEQFQLSEEVQDVMAGKTIHLSEKGMQSLQALASFCIGKFILAMWNIWYQIIKYIDSFAYTSDLANSIHGRGELFNHCMEVGIEYLRRTNTVEGKLIVPYQISVYLMNGEFEKKAVVSLFKRSKDYSLSVMKLISFLVLQEMARQQKEGNHWYSLSMNFQAERFEALDSIQGEGDEALISHANALISRIKAVWKIHYNTSKVQIQNWELKIINVPIQSTIFDCGYHALYNVEKWDGQNVPPLAKDDVPKLWRVMPHRWLTADFNKEKDNWKWNLFNNVIR